MNVMGADAKTTDDELAKKYLRFTNGLRVDGNPVIPATPSFRYTTNGIVFVDRAGFYNSAVLGAFNRLAGADAIYSRTLIRSTSKESRPPINVDKTISALIRASKAMPPLSR